MQLAIEPIKYFNDYYAQCTAQAQMWEFLMWIITLCIFYLIGIVLAIFVVKRNPRARLKRDRTVVFVITLLFWPLGLLLWAILD